MKAMGVGVNPATRSLTPSYGIVRPSPRLRRIHRRENRARSTWAICGNRSQIRDEIRRMDGEPEYRLKARSGVNSQ